MTNFEPLMGKLVDQYGLEETGEVNEVTAKYGERLVFQRGFEAVDDGETGFVVPVGDVDAMADAVRRLHDDRVARAIAAEHAIDDIRAELGEPV